MGARAGLTLFLVRNARPSAGNAKLLELAPYAARALREATRAMEKSGEVQATRDQRDLQAVAELLPPRGCEGGMQTERVLVPREVRQRRSLLCALAWVIAETPSRLREAAAIARDACEDGQGSPSACWTSARLEEDRGTREDRIQKLWNEVAPPAEQIALSNDG